jgi:uncharacterized protein YcnI
MAKIGLHVAGCAAAATLLAAPAVAHVTVWPQEVSARGFHAFTVRVPTERESATVSVRMEFPGGLKGIRFMPKPGWKYEVEREAAGGIAGVTWSGGKIGRDEFDEFHFTARMPEEPTTLSFVAHQTYEDGEIVDWAEPEGSKRPAARVRVGPPKQGASGAAADHGAQAPGAPAAEGRAAGPPAWMGWVNLLIAVAALLVALTRRSA